MLKSAISDFAWRYLWVLNLTNLVNTLNLRAIRAFALVIIALLSFSLTEIQAQMDCDFCSEDLVEFFLTSDVTNTDIAPLQGDEICYTVRVNNFCGITVFGFNVVYSTETLTLASTNTAIAQIPEFDESSVNTTALPDNVVVFFFPLSIPIVSRDDGSPIMEICFEVTGEVGETIRVDVGGRNLVSGAPEAVKADSTGAACPPDITEFAIVTTDQSTLPPIVRSACATGLEAASNVQCGSEAGLTDGSVEVQIFCGTGPYTLDVDNGASIVDTPDDIVTVSGLSPGQHTIQVTDQSTGEALGAPLQIDVPTSSGLVINSNIVQRPLCDEVAIGGPRGIITVDVTGGTPFPDGTYFYDWGGSDNGRDFVPDRFGSGMFEVTITDGLGCSTTESFDLTVEPVEAIATPNQSRCAGVNTAVVSVEGFGGVNVTGDGYRFFIQGVDLLGNPYNDMIETTVPTGEFMNVPGGTFQVWAEDDEIQSSLCNPNFFEFEVTIEQTYDIAVTPNTGLTCPMGESGVDIEVTRADNSAGNNISYEIFLKDNGTRQIVQSGGPTGDLTIQECLVEGDYDIEITDQEGCGFLDSFFVSGCALIVDTLTLPPICAGIDDGSIILTASGQTDPVMYAWDDGETTSTRVDLSPGSYAVTVSDAALCSLSFSFVFQEPQAIDVTFTADSISCPGETASITAVPQGGFPPYDYFWDPNPDNSLTETITGADAGTYRVTVVDFDGCEAIDSITIGNPAPPDIMIEAGPFAPSCEGQTDGRIQLSVITSATYPGPFIFTPPSGDAVQGDFSVSIDDLPEGDQFVIIETLDGCRLDTVEFTVPGGTGLEIDLVASTIPTVDCFGDEVFVTLVATGSGPITDFMWGDPINTTGATVSAPAGSFEVTITQGPCTSIDTVVVQGPEEFTSIIDPNQSDIGLCAGDLSDLVSITSGGTPPFNYEWTDLAGNVVSQDSVALGLSAGEYILNTSDAMACDAPPDTIVVNDVEEVTGTIGPVVQPFCFGDEGLVYIDQTTVSGGNGPYRFGIDALQPVDIQDTVSLPASRTAYQAIVFDVNGCQSATTDFGIVIPEEVSITLSGDTLIDIGFTGEIMADIVSPVDIDTVLWTTSNEGGELISCLNSDCSEIGIQPNRDVTFTATVINIDGCTAQASIDIDVVRNDNIYVPNVFKPGDGIVNNERNRTFGVFPGTAVEAIDYLRIFDRWGNMVYEELNLPLPLDPREGTGSWDGTRSRTGLGPEVQPGVYVWAIQVRFLADPNPQVRRGEVTILR